ncbi:MAG: serine/threonine protein kinase [Myxococcales bacterium]|nr:serine/threonine protein kinase [Myxococcales bacterium]
MMHAPAPALPNLGEVVGGKYRLDQVLGVGGMGVVMLAADTALGRPVAIKFLSRAKAHKPDAVARFQREARAAASLQSEHVVRVLEVGALPSGDPYIVMEHLRGADLAQVVQRRGGLPVEEAVEYVLQVCEALAEAHGQGIVHRDLKPQNLFVTQRPDGTPSVKVLDFGISKAAADTGSNLTHTETVLGTPLYMSPEQVRSLKNVDHRADIWAMGAILFELVAGGPLWSAPSPSALCAMIVVDPPPTLRQRVPAAPPGLEAIVARCLMKDAGQRFQTVGELAEALRPFAPERARFLVDRVQRVVQAVPVRPSYGQSAHPSPFVDPSGAAPTVAGGTPNSLVINPSYATDTSWASGTQGRAKGANTMLVAVLGGLAGMVLLGACVGAFFFVRWRIAAADQPPPPVAVVTAAPSTTAPAVKASTLASASAAPKASAAPSASAVASASTPPKPQQPGPGPGPTTTTPKPPPTNEFLEARRRQSEAECASARRWIDHGNYEAAKRVCIYAQHNDGTRCERATCELVCTKLNDTHCLQILKSVNLTHPSTM